MTVSLKHPTVTGIIDANAGKILQTQWNQEHTLTMGTGKLLGRTTASTGAVEEISVGTGLTFAAGSLSLDGTYADNRYVNVTGDTMTGALAISSGATAEALVLNTTGNTYASWKRSGTRDFYVQSNGTTAVEIVEEIGRPIRFYTNSALRVQLPSDAAGIQFPATQAASSNDNTLDDYEEGTWTPSSGTTNISVSTVYKAQYCKVGQLVYFYCYVELNNTTGAAASFIQINGLPFTNQTGAYPMAYPHYASNGSQNASALYSYINSASTTFYTSYTTSAITTGTAGYMWTGVYRASA